jgi:hypothetical protein
MKVVLCSGDVCETVKCPAVEIKKDCVVIGEYDNICTLTHKQFDILKEKILRNEI